MNSDQAILFIAHGSPRKEANDFIIELCQKIQSQLKLTVSPCFLNGKVISVEQAVADLVKQGYLNINICPFFLAPGEHIHKDIPLLVETLKENNPSVSFKQMTAFGLWERLPEVVSDFIKSKI